MAKYDPLNTHLLALETQHLSMDFSEIDGMVDGLPNSAYEHRAWWANTRSHPNAVAWLDAGWEVTDVDFRHHRVTMRRKSGAIGVTSISQSDSVKEAAGRSLP